MKFSLKRPSPFLKRILPQIWILLNKFLCFSQRKFLCLLYVKRGIHIRTVRIKTTEIRRCKLLHRFCVKGCKASTDVIGKGRGCVICNTIIICFQVHIQIIMTGDYVISFAHLRCSAQLYIRATLLHIIDPVRHINSPELIDMLLTFQLLRGKYCLSHHFHIGFLALLLRLTKRNDILWSVFLLQAALQHR